MDGLLEDFADNISSRLLAENKKNPLGRVVLMGNQVLAPTGEYSKNYGIYPESVMEMSKRIIENLRRETKEVFLVTLINDWKLLKGLPKAETIRRAYWHDPRFDYKQAMEEVWHTHLLRGKGPGEASKIDSNDHLALGRISEQRLHNEYTRLRNIDRNAERIDEALRDNHFQCELGNKSCDAGKCASEFIMSLRHFYKNRIERVIAFLPSECHGPIEAGAEVAEELQGIFMPDLDYKILVENFYFDSSGPKTIQELLNPNLSRKMITHEIR